MLSALVESLLPDALEALVGLNPWESWVCAGVIALTVVVIDACCAGSLGWAWYAWILAGFPLGWLGRLLRAPASRV